MNYSQTLIRNTQRTTTSNLTAVQPTVHKILRQQSFWATIFFKYLLFFQVMVKDPFNCETGMRRMVTCRPTIAYRVQADVLKSATKLITRYYSNKTLTQCSFNVKPTLAKCTMFEEKLSCQYTFWGSAVPQSCSNKVS